MGVPAAAALQQRYIETGDIAHLDAAIAYSRTDLAGCQPGSPSRQVHLSRLSNALRMRYEHAGGDRDLDEAIETGRACVDGTPAGHRFEPQRLSNLGYAHRLRYERLGRLADIERAIELGDRAVTAARTDDPTRPLIVSNLAVAYRVRHEISHDPADLARAVEAGTRCLQDTAPDAYERRGMLSNLGLAHYEHFEASGDQADLVKGARFLRQAFEVTPTDDPDWPMYALNLSVAMRTVAVVLNLPDAIDMAIAVAEQAYDRLPPGQRERGGALSELGRAHRIRAEMNDDPAERRLAVDYRRSAACDPVAAPTTRALAARAWGEWSHEDGDLTAAVEGFSTAVELLSVVTWHGLDTGTQQQQLTRWRELARAAAAICVDAYETERAVELLEQGRSVLWGQMLDRRADLDALRARHPALAARLSALRDTLDAGRQRETLANHPDRV